MLKDDRIETCEHHIGLSKSIIQVVALVGLWLTHCNVNLFCYSFEQEVLIDQMFCEIIGEAYAEAFGLIYASGECHSPLFSILKITLLRWKRCLCFEMFLKCCDYVLLRMDKV